ncbi:4'-phosphopantetheinyl transferase family protein [Roseovarius carneus]|uniref:4'-phosphopantetheinyl transferase family protein n=1 Tax=Roseovarius carneus TaxID=2853164 RepID=UPI001CCC48E1|nr:4'-phosphopantetheinyl transferase superfamily protein [Roseovarius carneus]
MIAAGTLQQVGAGQDALPMDIFPEGVAVAFSDPRAPAPDVWPTEAPAIANAAPRRRAEFAAGRAAARVAMARLGLPPAAVPAGADRAPIWPHRLTGSLTHNQTLCIAALARSEQFRALGVDVEEDAPLPAELIPTICTLAERAWLACQPDELRGTFARFIFSAKECAYKCQYGVTGKIFDFDTLEITPDLDTGQFEATFLRDIDPFKAGTCLSGRSWRGQGVIVTGMALKPAPRWGLRDL